MDFRELVEPAEKLVGHLRRNRQNVLRYAWVHSSERGWRLIIVPERRANERSFYEMLAHAINSQPPHERVDIAKIDVVDPDGAVGASLTSLPRPRTPEVIDLSAGRLGPYYFDRLLVMN